jgi:hypothetical protein
MNNKCSWPYCLERAVNKIKLVYTYRQPEVELCQYHYDRHLTADSCWEKIIKTEGYRETIMVFDDSALSIFMEAVLSYSMGSDATVALLCRASMESTMHAYISSVNPKYEKLPNDDSIFMSTLNHNDACDNIRLTGLINYLSKNNVLINMSDKINFVKDNGDFIAHHSERFWKSWNDAIKNNKIMNPIKLWVTDDEAKKSLTYTSEIISQLINTYYTNTRL